MAATEKKQMWFWANSAGGAPQTVKRQMASGQGIFMPGAGCYIDSTSGLVTLTDTSDNTGDTWHGFIVGVVDKQTAWPITAQLAANTEVEVALISTTHQYAIFVETGSADGSITQTEIGDSFGITVSTTGGEIGYATLALDNSNATVIVEEVMSNINPEKWTESTSPNIAIVRFLDANVNVSKA